MRGGRFEGEPDRRAADLGRSIDVDRELATDDLDGSMAHVRGLARSGLISEADAGALLEGLAGLRQDVEAGMLTWNPELEDVHLNLEAALAERIGPVGGRLHTGRSRNDQIATDLRIWLRRTVDGLDAAIVELERALVGLAERCGDAVMPGVTHLQPAQPVLVAHHLLAYVEMLERDRGRLEDGLRRANVSPLGSGAVAGAGYPIDREAVATDLGFDGVTANSIDATSDRDFAVEFLAAAALLGAHLSRLAEEIAWWSSPALGYVRVAEAFSTGSSMMPNKRNPDPAELVRGKAARLVGSLVTVLGLLKGLPLAYQRDLQESVQPLLDAGATARACVDVMAGLVATLEVDTERLAAATAHGHLTATSVADALVDRGVPFRAAHDLVGRLVLELDRTGGNLESVDDAAWEATLLGSPDATASALAADASLPAELRRAATIEAALARLDVIGGSAPARVRAALATARARLG